MNKLGLVMVPVLMASTLMHMNVAMAEAKGTIIGKVGTLGAGLEYVYPINPKLAVGFGVNGAGYSDSIEESDIDFDADLDMQSFSLLADYHPFTNGFRLSGGIMHNGNEFSLDGTPAAGTGETVEINNETYTADQVGSLESLVGFKSTAPYLGIGWGKAPKSGKGWGFDADLGVLFQGSPEVSLTATCGAAFDNDQAACDQLKADVANEEVTLKSDSEDFDIFPVISLGVSYTF